MIVPCNPTHKEWSLLFYRQLEQWPDKSHSNWCRKKKGLTHTPKSTGFNLLTYNKIPLGGNSTLLLLFSKGQRVNIIRFTNKNPAQLKDSLQPQAPEFHGSSDPLLGKESVTNSYVVVQIRHQHALHMHK